MKKILSLFVAMVMALSCVGITAMAEGGTSDMTISTVEELISFQNSVNNGTTYEGKTITLAGNLDLTSVANWTPIGTGTRSSKTYTGNAFKGNFDGAGCTINGLSISTTTDADAAIGLFGVVDGGTVKNLNLTNVNINVSTSDLVGGAIGMMLNNAKTDNIAVSGSVTGHDGVGGVVGRMIISGTISNCTNNASVTSSYGGIGGIVGKAYYEDSSNTSVFASVSNCTNNGTITAPMYVGGIVGLARSNVFGCVNNGAVVGGTQTGGIIGQLIAAGTVSDNVNNAKISGENHMGGIIGDYTQSSAYTYYNVSITNNTNRGELAATQQCAAIMGCNNIDGFTGMTASGNVSYYNAEGLELFGNPEDMVIDDTNKFDVEATPVAKIGDVEYATLAEAVANVKENETITILAGTISEGTIKLPATLKNVTFKGEEGAILEDMTIMASDGNSFSYIGLTFDGITFDNSRLIFTGWRNGEEVIENLTITNCVFQNLIDDTNVACVHINKAASEPVNGFIFINNVIDGATGGSKSGIYTVNTGKVIITGNTFNNIVFRPALVQLADCDGTVDNVVVSNNVISNTTRLQIYGSEVENEDGTYTPVGTDTLAIAINDNIFQNITGYYICTWGINGKSDIAENYYDGDISGKIYWNNEKPADEAGLAEIGVYPYYTELNTDGTINTESLVEAPTNKVAKIRDTTFTTLQAAIDAANNGDTIVVLADMTFESNLADAGKGYFNIPDGKKVTIDLNEKTINVTENSAGNFILFYNYGELTIKNGTVNLTSIQNRGWNAESAIILNRGGILNVESGTFTHLGGTDMAFVVDNSGNWFGEATANIEGGSLTSSYIAIRNRMEQNEHGYSGTAYLNIAGGTISGNSRAVWAQASSTSEKSPATGVINVTGGNIGKIDTARSSGAVCMTTVSGGTVASFKVEKGELKITGGTVTGTLTILDASGNTVESDEIISGGTFSGDVKSYLADGCTLTANGDGTYSVERAGTLATENVLIQNMAQGTTATGDPTYRVGCFAAIDSANYSLLGIEVKADNGKVTGSGTTQYLYTYINVTNSKGEVTKILPETLGETNKYIFGRIMAFTTNYTDFSFRPFAVSLDGKKTFYGNWSKEYTVDPE